METYSVHFFRGGRAKRASQNVPAAYFSNTCYTTFPDGRTFHRRKAEYLARLLFQYLCTWVWPPLRTSALCGLELDMRRKLGMPKFWHVQSWLCPKFGRPSVGHAQSCTCPELGMPRVRHAQSWACPELGMPKVGHAKEWACPRSPLCLGGVLLVVYQPAPLRAQSKCTELLAPNTCAFRLYRLSNNRGYHSRARGARTVGRVLLMLGGAEEAYGCHC